MFDIHCIAKPSKGDNVVFIEKIEDARNLLAKQFIDYQEYLDSKNMKSIYNVKSTLENEVLKFSIHNQNLVPYVEKLNLKIIDFLKNIKPDNIDIKITLDKSIFMILEKDQYEIFLEAFIENDNHEIEGIVKIYREDILINRKYGKQDLLFKEVNNTFSNINKISIGDIKYYLPK